MKKKTIFQKYYSKFHLEAICNSAFCGVAIGAGVNLLLDLVFFVASLYYGYYIALGVGIIAGVLSGLLFYFKKFIPTPKGMARRLDSVGLEERIITMNELENDDSYVAVRQREDATEQLSNITKEQVKWKNHKGGLISACCLAPISLALSIVFFLNIFTFNDFLNLFNKGNETTFNITYSVEKTVAEKGIIIGNLEQVVKSGEDAQPVVALAAENYMFAGWSDGYTSPARTDINVTKDINVVAIFTEVIPGDDYVESEQKDQPNDLPQQDGDGEDQNGDPSDSPQGGGSYEHNNNIIDGNTFYGDVYEMYYKQAMELLASDKEISDELRAFIENYFKSMK